MAAQHRHMVCPLPMVELLPNRSEQERLVDGLGNLISQVGYESLVTHPIFMPTNEHFPDRIRGTVGGVRTLLRRLLAYAGVRQLSVMLEVFDSDNPYVEVNEEGLSTKLPDHAAAWFSGIHDGACRFGLDVHVLQDGDYLVGVLCHEVAHAFRHEQGIEAFDRDTEELLTDLTTIVLGFGLFTTNNSYLYRTGGTVEGVHATLAWSERRAGYLSPVEFSFLLALQSVVRKMTNRQLKRLRGHLETNQRAMFDAARAELQPEVDELRLRLGIPPPEEWPEPITAEILSAPLISPDPNADIELDATLLAEATLDDGLSSSPRRTHRLESNQRTGGMWIGVFAGVICALLVARQSAVAFWALIALGLLLGRAAGKQIKFYRCTNFDCEAEVDRDASNCPSCGLRFQATVTTLADILDD